MRTRSILYACAAALLTVTAGVIAQTSGLPSRPRFQSVGVGVAAPVANGNLTATGTVTAADFVGNIGGEDPTNFALLDQQNTWLYDLNQNAGQAFINTSAGTSAQNVVGVSNLSNSLFMNITGTGYSGTRLTGGPTGQAAHIFTDNTAVPLVFGTGSTERVRIAGNGASINLTATAVQANGSNIWTAANDGAGSGLDADLLDAVSSASFARVDAATNFTTAPTISSQGVCLANGTNCPAAVAETTGSFNVTLTSGCTTTPTYNFVYTKVGNIVTVTQTNNPGQCTSNSTGKQFTTALPVAIRPATTSRCGALVSGTDNAVRALMSWRFGTTGSIDVGVENLSTLGAPGCGGPNATSSGQWQGGSTGTSWTYALN